jgi:hypothetical protein
MTIPKKYLIPALVLIVILIFLFCRYLYNSSIEKNNLKHNISALNDTIREYTTKNGTLYSEKLAFISTLRDLETLNAELYESIKDLESVKGNKKQIIAGTITEVQITDTVFVDHIYQLGDCIILSDTCIQQFQLPITDSIITIDISATLSQLIHDHKISSSLYVQDFRYNIAIPVEVYFTKDARILIKSKNPNVSFPNITSFIDPSVISKAKPKRWGIGFQAGVGLGIGYDLISRQIVAPVGTYIGFGISYNLFSW